MIETIVHVNNPEQIELFTQSGCRNFVVTTAFLSSAIINPTQIDNLNSLKSMTEKFQSKLGLLINRVIVESEFETLIKEIDSILQKVTFDYFIVSDVGVMFYLKAKLTKDIFFHSDTTIANANDAMMLLENGATLIMPAREITYEKKVDIVVQYPKQIMLPVFGYQVMSKSYRPLLTNYFNQINQTKPSQYEKFYFKEDHRSQKYIGFEDQHGFSMFTDTIVHLIDEKINLENIGLKYGWIDTNFIEDNMIAKVIAYFSNKITYDEVNQYLRQQSQNHQFSSGLNYQDTTLAKEKII